MTKMSSDTAARRARYGSVAIGDVVVRRGWRYRVSEVRPTTGIKPSLSGLPAKIRGGFIDRVDWIGMRWEYTDVQETT